jgi:hypothetical protein
MAIEVRYKGRPERRVIPSAVRTRFPHINESPHSAAARLIEREGPKGAAEFVYGRIAEHGFSDRRHDFWSEVMRLIQQRRPRIQERKRQRGNRPW